MWAQLAMAGVKSLQENQNRKNDIASNVITQKYSPWTGAEADFSQQGKNNTLSNFMTGYGSGVLQDKADAKDLAEKAAQETAKQTAVDKADGDYYSKLSANPASVGVSPIGGKNTSPVGSNSAFAAAAQNAGRAPAIGGDNGAPPFDLMGSVAPYQDPTPLMLQGQVPGATNPFMNLAKSQLISGKNDPVKPSYGLDNSVWLRR